MPEELEEGRSGGSDFGTILGIVRRRHLFFLIPLFAGWFLVWGASWILQPRYKSTTLILVQQPTMPQDYVAPNISDDIQSRLSSITQQVLSRTRLLVILNKLNLYGGGKDPSKADQEVEQMRKDITIELVHDPQRNEVSGFRISFTARDPHLAQQVTGELTDLFINENSQARLQASQGTTSFIEKQLAQASADLASQEAKVKEFEATHEGALPTQQSSNLEILSGLNSQLENEQGNLNTAKQQHVYLQAMIEQERAAEAKAPVTSSEGGGASGSNDLATVNQQLTAMKAQLADLSSRYTDRYPDVVSLKSQIARTETLRDSLIAAARQRNAEARSGDGSEDPAASATLRQLQGQLQSNQLEITNRENTIRDLQNRIGGYQGRLNSEPGTEQQLADLNRGYNQSMANYDDLLKKRDSSAMATNMELLQQGTRFTILDPPSLPTAPDFPDRLKFCEMGLGAGLALGLIIAGAFEFFDDRLHAERQIKALLPMSVISEIPEIDTVQDQEKARKTKMLGWATTAVVFTTIIAGSLLSLLYK